MSGCELIIYATPRGQLADACADYFAWAAATEPTVAQTYPPHCTLTGFFRRSPARRDAIVERVARLLATTGHPPSSSVEVVGFGDQPDWVGLEVVSPWLIEWTEGVAAELAASAGEDALRLKTWLHLSLAYGIGDLDLHRARAVELVDPTLSVEWRVGLWERSGTNWSCLAGG